MKYAAKYLLILGILGMSQSSILGQETQVAPIMNTAQFNLSDSRVMINNQLLEEKITVEEADGTYYVQARVLAEKILKEAENNANNLLLIISNPKIILCSFSLKKLIHDIIFWVVPIIMISSAEYSCPLITALLPTDKMS